MNRILILPMLLATAPAWLTRRCARWCITAPRLSAASLASWPTANAAGPSSRATGRVAVSLQLRRLPWRSAPERRPPCPHRRSHSPPSRHAHAQRFSNPARVEKRFRRDCNEVLGRMCTAEEKADFIKFVMAEQPS